MIRRARIRTDAAGAIARRAPRLRRGFTLVEAVCAMVVLGTLGSLSAALMVRAADAYRAGATAAALHAELAAALDPVERTVRSIAINAGRTGPAVNQLDQTALEWNTGAGTGSLSLSGTNLMFSPDGQPPAVILTGVTSLVISAFGDSNNALAATLRGTATAAIRRLSITVTVTRGGVSDTLRTRVYLRCMSTGTAS
jgi:prepilin-type N-terminal cleavage/methylation domain-containing protein